MHDHPPLAREASSPSDHLRHAVEHAAHLLPAQGPITVFIHHNTLHAFEHLPFTEGVRLGARLFGCQPFLSEERYREALTRGRIRFLDLEAVLTEELGPGVSERVAGLCTRLVLRSAMLEYPLRYGPAAELRWHVAETDALRRVRPDVSAATRARLIAETRRWVMRDLRGDDAAARAGSAERRGGPAAASLSDLLDRVRGAGIEDWGDEQWEAFTLQALWRVCCGGVALAPVALPPPPPLVRHRDLLLAATGEDTDALVHDLLIRYCAAFLDQGLAQWPLPQRELGFLGAFSALYARGGGPPDRWLAGLAGELASMTQRGVGALESVQESLNLLGVPEEEWDEFIAATLLALRGWAGMVWQVEQRGDRVPLPAPPGSLIEFLAVRLLLDRLAAAHVARTALGATGPLYLLRDEIRRQLAPPPAPSVEPRAFIVFQLAQVLGWCPDELYRLSAEAWTSLVSEVEAFNSVERRQTFHLAYERRFRKETLDVVGLHRPRRPAGTPRFQAIFCLDEREESLRRHLEEVAPDAETFGAAGFYGVAIYYRGAADAYFVPLCPIVITPRHWVAEQVEDALEEEHRRRARARRALGTAYHRIHSGSRTFALGALVSAGLGVLASVPLTARILFPRLTARLRRLFGSVVQPPATRLSLERHELDPGPDNGHLGFTLEEMVDLAERQLRDLGLTRGFARLVLILGHGSNSLNNPHKSAYDCGACGGSPGAPNGRALAQMLNDVRVRERLAARGLALPDTTVFVGGLHNTCNDTVVLFDTERLPPTHRADLEAAVRDIEEACGRNAHERSRRFRSAPLTMTFEAARQHVEGRGEDLAQTRPELGHATNALCIIGRRERTRGLYLDRRAFLTSYDPTQDDNQATILIRILQAAVPVCAGINLEYYFSRVDNTGYGCGTKLPHNVTAQLGVMDGAASDLRTGLPWQMVEIHEPVRLLMIIETTPEAMLSIIERNETIGRPIRNGWVHLAVLDPHSNRLRVYDGGRFRDFRPQARRTPKAASSIDWYRGWRDHLEFAEIEES